MKKTGWISPYLEMNSAAKDSVASVSFKLSLKHKDRMKRFKDRNNRRHEVLIFTDGRRKYIQTDDRFRMINFKIL